jgi:hypothetical protein
MHTHLGRGGGLTRWGARGRTIAGPSASNLVTERVDPSNGEWRPEP